MKTQEEVRGDYVRLMGVGLGSLVHELTLEEDWLRDKWTIFRELFEHGGDRIDLLNRTAPNFFYFLHKLLYEDAMLHLSRLTDPPETYRKANLTVRQLDGLIADPNLKGSVEGAIKDLVITCKFARDIRNRRLAHTDLNSTRSGDPYSSCKITSTDVTRALKGLRTVLSLIENHYSIPPTLILRDPWGAEALVRCLQISTGAKDERAPA